MVALVAFKIGDRVRICDKRPNGGNVFWNPDMDRYLGEEGSVVTVNTTYCMVGFPDDPAGWAFDRAWLTVAAATPDFKEGDEVVVTSKWEPENGVFWSLEMDNTVGLVGVVTKGRTILGGHPYVRFPDGRLFYYKREVLEKVQKAPKPEQKPLVELPFKTYSEEVEKVGEQTFEDGDEVVVVAKDNNEVSGHDCWVDAMDASMGKTGKVKGRNRGGDPYVLFDDIGGFYYRKEWLKKVSKKGEEGERAEAAPVVSLVVGKAIHENVDNSEAPLKVGDEVVVVGPNDGCPRKAPWVDGMDSLIGRTGTITNYWPPNFIMDVGDGRTYYFLEGWLKRQPRQPRQPQSSQVPVKLTERVAALEKAQAACQSADQAKVEELGGSLRDALKRVAELEDAFRRRFSEIDRLEKRVVALEAQNALLGARLSSVESIL